MKLELAYSEDLRGKKHNTVPEILRNGSKTIKLVFDDGDEKEKTGGSLSYTRSKSSGGSLNNTSTILFGEQLLDRTKSYEKTLIFDEQKASDDNDSLIPRNPPPVHPSTSVDSKIVTITSRDDQSRCQLKSARYDSDFESEGNNDDL